ncbi:hypothetical protein HLB42_14745 [Deinococcus sp. D7000]|nr:hypothetical protein HLB42_14745 [Deinococcus sp. D7000]
MDAMWLKRIRPMIALLGVLSALYITFIHPPLVLTAGLGDYANARSHCQQTKDDVYLGIADFFSSDAEKQLAEVKSESEFRRCMSNANVYISELLLQLAVIAVSTFALLWATRISP